MALARARRGRGRGSRSAGRARRPAGSSASCAPCARRPRCAPRRRRRRTGRARRARRARENSEKFVPSPSHVGAERERAAGPDLAARHRDGSAPGAARAGARPSRLERAPSWVASDDLVRPSTGTARGAGRRSCTASGERAAAHAQPARVLVEGDVVDLAVRAGRGARASSARVERRAAGVAARASASSARTSRGSCGSGTSSPANSRERGELAPAPLARGDGDLLVDVVGEELERRALAVLLAHEQHRRERRQQRAERGERPGLGGQPVAEGAVADLVVVLGEDDELLDGGGRRRARRSAGGGTSSTCRRARAGGGRPWRGRPTRPELLVLALALAGEQDAQGVVEVVGPRGVVAEAAAARAGASTFGSLRPDSAMTTPPAFCTTTCAFSRSPSASSMVCSASSSTSVVRPRASCSTMRTSTTSRKRSRARSTSLSKASTASPRSCVR